MGGLVGNLWQAHGRRARPEPLIADVDRPIGRAMGCWVMGAIRRPSLTCRAICDGAALNSADLWCEVDSWRLRLLV